MRFPKLYGAKLFITGIAFIVGIIAGSFIFSYIPALANTSSPNFKVNKNGETYGSLMDVTVPGQEPALIQAEGVDGTIGYVRFQDLNGDGQKPKNPEEAVAYMKKMKNSEPRYIPLYDSDGKTVIGKFKNDVPKEKQITQEDIVKKLEGE